MMHRLSPAATEPFFDLLPRHPHAIKVLFHAVQMPFILIFGYSPFSLRLLSLIAGFLGIYAFYKLLSRLFRPPVPFALALIFSIDIQFIYASHFARQEILLTTALILALYFFRLGAAGEDRPRYSASEEGKLPHREPETHLPPPGGRRFFRLSALTVGLSIGIHPNSFLISLPVGAFFLVRFLFRRSLRDLGEYVGILAAFAALFVGLSYAMDPDFLSHYAETGKRLEVGVPFYIKIFRFPDFYLKLFHGISGTYYTPDIRLQFYLFAAALVLSIPLALFDSKRRRLVFSTLLGIVFLNLGTLFLGKYSQPSIILHFPLYYLLLAAVLDAIPRSSPSRLAGKVAGSPAGETAEQQAEKHRAESHRDLFAGSGGGIRNITVFILAGAVFTSSLFNILGELHLRPPKSATAFESYSEYEEKIHRYIPENSRVLANLNSGFAFDYEKLYDYRNLAYLEDEELTFGDYIRDKGIEYILYPQEMDVIYRKRPVWNILYGNVASYYEEMQRFLDHRCRKMGSFRSPTYGMRITRYMGRRPWEVTVYRVIDSETSSIRASLVFGGLSPRDSRSRAREVSPPQPRRHHAAARRYLPSR